MEAINIDKNLNAKVTPDDWEMWLGNGTWRSVQCLVEAPNFNSSPIWIAERLGITVVAAVEALEALIRLGCIKRRENTFDIINDWHQLTEKDLESVRMVRAHLLIASPLLAKLKPEDKFTSQFLRVNQSILDRYAPKFKELYRQMNEDGIKQGCTEVYGSQITFTQVTKTQTEGGLS